MYPPPMHVGAEEFFEEFTKQWGDVLGGASPHEVSP